MDLKQLLAGFEGVKRTDEIAQLYDHYKKDIQQSNWLGDKDASDEARRLLAAAMKQPISSAFPQLKRASKIALAKESKLLSSELRETSRELALRVRSERFIGAIQSLLRPLTGTQEKAEQTFHCSSPDCKGTAGLAQLHVITQCGHTACDDCLSSRVNPEACVQPQCNVTVQSVNLVRATSLGSNDGQPSSKQSSTLSPGFQRVIRVLFSRPTTRSFRCLKMSSTNVAYRTTRCKATKLLQQRKSSRTSRRIGTRTRRARFSS